MTTPTVSQQVPDRVFVDSDRKDLFFKISSCRSPFLDAERWPYLEDEFAESSRHLLEECGLV